MSPRHRLGADRVVTPAALRPIVEMNVTALLGVVMVVLCGFLAFSLAQSPRLDVQLPASTPEAIASYSAAMQKRIARGGGWCSQDYVVRIRTDGQLDVNNQLVPANELGERLRAIFEYTARPCRIVFVQPAANTRYGDVVTVVDAAKGAGVEQVVMLSADGRAP